MKMKILLTTFFFHCLTFFAFAENIDLAVSGKVLSNEQPAPFVNVALVTAEGKKLITGQVTDEQGNFVIKLKEEGEYRLKIQSVGYETFVSETFRLNRQQPRKKFDKLHIKESVTMLESVEIRGQKVLVEQKVDRTVLNVKGAMLTSGETALNILRKMPGLYVDKDKQIRMVGKSGPVIVMIDGNRTYMSSKELSEMLETMSADNIKSIEVIKNPSAKYDAEGNSGILDIKLVKRQDRGYDASVYGTYNHGMSNSVKGGGNFRFSSSDWSGYANLDGDDWNSGRKLALKTVYTANDVEQTHDQNVKVLRKNKNIYWHSGVDYRINDKSSVGAVLRLSRSRSNHDFFTHNDIYQNNLPSAKGFSEMISEGESFRTIASLHYNLEIDSTSSISANLDGTVYDNEDHTNTETQYNEKLNGKSRLFKPYHVKLIAGQVDWTKQSSWAKLELGLKASYSDLQSEAAYDSLKNGVWQPDLIQSDRFNFHEFIGGAYINLSGKWNKLSWQAGMRTEYTNHKGHSESLNQTNRNDYLKLFPSAFLSYNMHEDHQTNLSYSFRIRRPRYWQLNPFPIYIGAGIVSIGDPYLRPAITDNLEWSYLYKKKYTLSVSYAHSENSVEEVPYQDNEKQQTIYRQDNIGSRNAMSFSLSAPFDIAKWWQSRSNFSLSYAEISYAGEGNLIDISRWTPQFNTTHTFLLPWEIKAEASYFILGKSVYGGWYNDTPMQSLDVSFEKSMLNDQLSLSASISDIFNKSNFSARTLSTNSNSHIYVNRDSRCVRLTLRYKFNRGGKVKVKQRKQTNREIMNRI
ncbi:MAG: TonB-dependent receptor family protein [Cytophagales bacterium]|nr:TonB-dependent receptor family protein [Cytophagales bacterium]